MLTFSFKAF